MSKAKQNLRKRTRRINVELVELQLTDPSDGGAEEIAKLQKRIARLSAERSRLSERMFSLRPHGRRVIL